jgi:hypothetical protein
VVKTEACGRREWRLQERSHEEERPGLLVGEESWIVTYFSGDSGSGSE